MNSSLVAALICVFFFAAADPSQSQTLEKIDKAGTLVIGDVVNVGLASVAHGFSRAIGG